MTDFSFHEVVTTEAWESAALGTASGTAGQFTAKDIGRAVTQGTAQNFVECITATGVNIEGFIAAVQPFTVNGTVAGNYTFGSVQREGRRRVKASGTIAFGKYVQASATAPATGTTETLATVVEFTTPVAGVPLWKFIRNFTNANPSAAAVSGNEILIERI